MCSVWVMCVLFVLCVSCLCYVCPVYVMCPVFTQDAATNQEDLKLNASTSVLGVTVVYRYHRVVLYARIA